jgi:outer membrane protein assembly factor BamE (lipoprotein component of BamABCDE complex)
MKLDGFSMMQGLNGEWKSTHCSRPTKGKMPKSKFMKILVVSFNNNGFVKNEYVPSDQTMNQ